MLVEWLAADTRTCNNGRLTMYVACMWMAAAFERSEVQAGRELPRNATTAKGKKTSSSAGGSSHQAPSHNKFPSRAAEGEYMSNKNYTDQYVPRLPFPTFSLHPPSPTL